MNERQELINTIYENMSTLKRGMYNQVQHVKGDLNLSTSQLDLAFVIQKFQPIGVNSIAAHMQLTPGAVSQMVEVLVSMGLVDRHADSQDRRKQALKLTDNGETTLLRILMLRQKIFNEIMDILSDTELKQWLNIQTKIIKQISKHKVIPPKEV